MPRTWLWMALATGCAADEGLLDDTGEAPAPTCVEEARRPIGDDAVDPEGPATTVSALLRGVEGTFRGLPDARTPGVELRTEVARGEGPAALVTARWSGGEADGEPCPARYAIPVLQTLGTAAGDVAAVAAGQWLAGDDLAGFVATSPLIEVDGLAPATLVPAEWETLDLALRSSPTPDGGLHLSVAWSAARATAPTDAMLAPGTATTDAVTVSTATEPVWTASLVRE